MKNVASVFGKAVRRTIPYNKVEWVLPEQLTGLEIELENGSGVIHPTNLMPYWTRVRDGSLRSGYEYVLAGPLKGDTLARAISEIFHGAVMARSTTGSTHIHIDMMEEATTVENVKLLVLLIYMLEPAIFALADPGREWCGYTNKLSTAPDALIGSVLNCREDNNFEDLQLLTSDRFQTGRYYGLNLLALQEHGSIEFRYFPTATSPEELTDWVQLVQSFKKAAVALLSVEELMRVIESDELYESFIRNYFGRWQEIFLNEVPRYVASNALNKALAVAASFHMHRNHPAPQFNVAAVTDNPLLKRFVKKVAKSPEAGNNRGVIVLGGNDSVPNASTLPTGTFLLMSGGSVYVVRNRAWTPLTNPDIFNTYIPSEDHARALANLQFNKDVIRPLLMQKGASPGRVDGLFRVTDRAARSLSRAMTAAAVTARPSILREEVADSMSEGYQRATMDIVHEMARQRAQAAAEANSEWITFGGARDSSGGSF